MYANKSLKNYLDDLAAKKPAPGGGSAAALVGALATALLSMAANYTVGREKYKPFEKEIKEALRKSEGIRKRFLSLVDLDVKAYYKVFNSRKSSHSIYERNLINATMVPLEICQQAVYAYKLYPLLSKKANRYLISDVYVARELLKACFKSAELNVRINLPQIQDKKFVSQTIKILQNLRRAI